MTPIKYHILNSAIAGALVFLGSLTPLLIGEFNIENVIVGVIIGFIAGFIIFLNKFNEWLITQTPEDVKKKIFQFI